VITAVVSCQMNGCWAALAGEAIVSYRGKIAGHTRGGTFSYMLMTQIEKGFPETKAELE
jgi:hypothetical protein